jgi:hypothetical protein
VRTGEVSMESIPLQDKEHPWLAVYDIYGNDVVWYERGEKGPEEGFLVTKTADGNLLIEEVSVSRHVFRLEVEEVSPRRAVITCAIMLGEMKRATEDVDPAVASG